MTTEEVYPMEWETDERELDQEPVLLEDKTVIGRDPETGQWRVERTTVRDHTVRRTTVARSSATATFREARRVANNLSANVYVRADDRQAAEAELSGDTADQPMPVPPDTKPNAETQAEAAQSQGAVVTTPIVSQRTTGKGDGGG